jgi:hypothetical protein
MHHRQKPSDFIYSVKFLIWKLIYFAGQDRIRFQVTLEEGEGEGEESEEAGGAGSAAGM